MSKNRLLTIVSAFAALAMTVSACGPAATPVPPTAGPNVVATTASDALTQTAGAPAPTAAATDTPVPPTPDATGTATAEIGTDPPPVQVLFVPSVDANILT